MVQPRDIQALGDLVIDGHLGRRTAERILDALKTPEAEGEADLKSLFRTYIENFQKEQTIPEPAEETVKLSPEETEVSAQAATISEGRSTMPAQGADVHVGTTLPGSERYQLVEKLGEGGAGTVWLAEDELLQRTVALKVLLDELQDPDRQAERFLFEARTTGRLDHPGVIPVYDVGKLPDGRWFYTMQLIDDYDFEDVLDKRSDDEELQEDYPLPRLLKIFSRVCLTMAYAHDSGIIHRDLKPANILLGAYGEVYVVDWGLSKLFDEDVAAPVMQTKDTKEGEVIGTPYYMSPEQIRGENAELGPPTDVYSLGVILFRLLTGRVPFDAPSVMSLLLKVETEDPPDPRETAPDRDVPDPMAEAAMLAMSDAPEDRMTARELSDRVTEYLDGVKERERREARAEELLDRARALHEAYLQTLQAVEANRSNLEERLANLSPADGLEARKPLWEEEREIDERAHEAEELYSKSLQAARESLENHATREAERLITDLYWYKFQEARQERDEGKALYFRALVEEYDDGRYADRLANEGELRITLPDDVAEATFYREEAVGPLLERTEVDVEFDGRTNFVETGAYRLDVETGSNLNVELPLEVTGHPAATLDVSLPDCPENGQFCFIPEGRYTVGGDELAPKSLPKTDVDIGPYLMRQHPVTLAEYCDFLNAIAESDFDEAKNHSPRLPDQSTFYLEIDEEQKRFSVPEVDNDGHAWDPDWPVVLINWYDAKSFIEWRSHEDGVDYQLPSEIQWEVAARGVDRRVFPWGNGFDPTLCRMAESSPGRSTPTRVGSYPYDRSPFGVYDMAGLVIEWTRTQAGSTDAETYIQRGGGFQSPSNWCRAAARKNNGADMVFRAFGFRFLLELD